MTRPTYYVLNERREVIPTRDVLEWGRMFESIDGRRVALTDLGLCNVSTVFLGMDHRFMGEGPPVVFETMVFLTLDTGHEAAFVEAEELAPITCQRYSTWAEAELGHVDLCEEIEARIAVARARSEEITAAFLARIIEAAGS